MKYRKTFSISGTVFTLILVYFIYLVARDKGWKALSFLTGAYLFIVLGFFALAVLIILLLIIIPLFILRKQPSVFKKFRAGNRKKKPKTDDEVIDVDFKVKE